MKNGKPCPICGSAMRSWAKSCRRCSKIVSRLDTRGKADVDARRCALKAAWTGEGVRCHNTGLHLKTNGHHDPMYLTFDHRVPRVESDVVVCPAVVNDMKTDLDEGEFKQAVCALADYFRGVSALDAAVLHPKKWKRV